MLWNWPKKMGRDFVLKRGSTLFYFAHDLSRQGDAHVTTAGGGSGPRAMSQLPMPIRGARWLDNNESLKWTQDAAAGLAALDCTGYPYGSNLVVRVAEITLQKV